jgi:hypothetical protein
VENAADDNSSRGILVSLVPNRVISWNEEDMMKYESATPQSGAQKSNKPKIVTYFPIISFFNSLPYLVT